MQTSGSQADQRHADIGTYTFSGALRYYDLLETIRTRRIGGRYVRKDN